jgi:hypothetical protein
VDRFGRVLAWPSKAHQKSGSFAPQALPSLDAPTTLSDSRHGRRLSRRWGSYPHRCRVSPDYPNHLSDVPRPLPRRIERVSVSIASPLVQPSPNGRRVGIRSVTFEACSGFTHVTARRIAQPPKATFVARLQPGRLPNQAARQLPDLSTIIRVRSSLTDSSRLRGALPCSDMQRLSDFTGIAVVFYREDGVARERPCAVISS